MPPLLLEAMARWALVASLLTLGARALRDTDLALDAVEEDAAMARGTLALATNVTAALCPNGTRGKTKALSIAFGYKSDGMLSGTCEDMRKVVQFAAQHGYADVAYLTDSCTLAKAVPKVKALPNKATKAGVRAAIKWLLKDACAGDALFFHYSGHGSFVKEDEASKDECNGKDEVLVLPVETKTDKYYSDDELFDDLVKQVPAGVHLFAIVDACHSGTILDLPWNWMSQKYYYSCEGDRSKRKYDEKQFVWEWKSPPSQLERPYPLAGTVTLIAASQNGQTSGDFGLAREKDKDGKVVNLGSLLSYRLLSEHRDYKNRSIRKPAILTEALAQGWSWADTMMELIRQVAAGDEKSVTSNSKQIPNFCASHRLDMGKAFSLDASPFASPPSENDPSADAAEKLKCDNGGWIQEKDKLKVTGCDS